MKIENYHRLGGIPLRREKLKISKSGFSLIELMVSMFILALVLGGMVAVSVSVFQSYQKSKAIKTVSENVGFALNSIAKDVRMGKIENGNGYATGSTSQYLLVSRNSGGRVCYKIDTSTVGVADLASGNDCSGLTYSNKLVDLTGTSMSFDASSMFRSCISDNKGDGTMTACNGISNVKRRGWAEINLNVLPTGGVSNAGMTNDMINVQTTVSSRDYGW